MDPRTFMTDITLLLQQSTDENNGSLDQVFQLLHADLKALAHNRIASNPSQSMTATALVHELYLKLIGNNKLSLESRHHFFACAGRAMRFILVDAARAWSAEKRGGDVVFVTLNDAEFHGDCTELLALNQAMDELKLVNPELMQLVQLRFFAGISLDEIAAMGGRSVRSLQRDWQTARAFLNARMSA